MDQLAAVVHPRSRSQRLCEQLHRRLRRCALAVDRLRDADVARRPSDGRRLRRRLPRQRRRVFLSRGRQRRSKRPERHGRIRLEDQPVRQEQEPKLPHRHQRRGRARERPALPRRHRRRQGRRSFLRQLGDPARRYPDGRRDARRDAHAARAHPSDEQAGYFDRLCYEARRRATRLCRRRCEPFHRIRDDPQFEPTHDDPAARPRSDERVAQRERPLMLLLGIETSCDDTATALERAGTPFEQIDGIAVTAGPGLIGSLVVGVATAKALAFAGEKPLYAVNHLHGHIFAAFLERGEPEYPFLALLVSGGHSQLVRVDGPAKMEVIGKTLDDAAGEAFDKTARLLGLGFPGGPELDRLARDGDPAAYAFPRHRAPAGSLDMSFSGLKTSVRYFLESPAGKDARPADVAASFQAAVVDILMDRVELAAQAFPYRCAVLSGAVAANSALQRAFLAWGERTGITTIVPPLRYCTDNAAMIAAAADRRGETDRVDPLALSADPNLPF